MAVLDISPILHETLAGRYVLKREIGRGGAATVYLAHDVRHERLVAIKVLHPELSHALGAQRFLREIKLTASLQHPHILPIHDSGEAHDQLFYVMPYVEGDSMRHRLGADNRLSIDEAVRIGREVSGALAYAHERGVVHRDIKPENILFSGGHAILADFGIARAINRAHEKITQQGTITGTPAYMSPEQARDRAFDGRSDVYSLACVLYEAIAGVPPFVGETPQQLLTQRISKTPPLLREYRHDVPLPIETVIAKALSISPDDRFDDARAFSAALSGAIGHSGETVSGRVVRRPLVRSPWLWAAGFVVLAVSAVTTSAKGRDQLDVLTGRVDSAQYAVMPFQYVGAPTPPGDQEPVAQVLYSALREWNGLKLASDVSVFDALRRSSDSSLTGVTATARRTRAGKMVWGRVWVMRDSVRVRAGVYDAVSGTSLRELTITGPRDMLTSQPGALRALATDLLRIEGVPARARGGDVGTRSFAAWHTYQEGQQALGAWRVAAAMDAFDRAAATDPDYAHAHLWLAQLQIWRLDAATKWGPHVSSALRNRVSLDERETTLLDALQAIQNGRLGEACAAYEKMRQRDSLDATAWLGLAYCSGYDRLVVRSSASPSGWMFLGSVAAAQRAYARALQIAPASFAVFPFSFVTQHLFVVETNRYRNGANADSALFFAVPDLIGDTISYVPRPFRDLNTPPLVLAPALDRSLQRNRESLLGVLSALTLRLSDNADAFESLSRVLETRDEITGTPNGGHSALSALERAKTLATDPEQRARLGASDVRLHLKLGDFSRAAAIGDSVLSAMPLVTGPTALQLVGVAALLGREHTATAYLRASGETMTTDDAPRVPLLEDASTALFMRAALGVCDDSLRALQSKVNSLLNSYVSATQRDAARIGMLSRPMQLAIQCLGPEASLALSGRVSPHLQTIQALGRHDLRRAQFQLDSLQSKRRLLRPGEFSLDYTLTEAWIRTVLGDSIAAAHQLDLTLTALPTLSPHVVFEPGMAAAVGRSMAFRATLAARMGDPGTAALWASRVLTLWANADPSLGPTLARMKALTAHRS
jgi:tRNA A-37 threonylcarbamoyl transferase component Bud32/tetratricopeptide (TPR) repeat protein